MTSRSNVRPPIVPLTEYDARELLSKPLVDLCAEHGPTRVAGSVGCDEKTIRNARDEKSTLRLDFASNLLALDGRALDPILNHYGRRSVPVDATCDTDALPAMTGAVHKLVSSIAPHSDEGVNLSRRELLDAKDDLRAAYDAIGALLTRIEAYERGEAA